MTDTQATNRRLSPTDALLLRLERSPMLRSTIVQVALLEHAPDHERFRTKVLGGIGRVPRINQVPVRAPVPGAAPVWRTTADFDLDYHVQYTRLREPAGMRQLLDYASHLAMRPFDPARPLWESHIVEGLADGRAAAIQKIHHSLGDGIGLLDIVLTFVDFERDASEPVADTDAPVADGDSTLTLLAEAVRADAGALVNLVRGAPGAVARAGLHPVDAITSFAGVARSLARVASPGGGPLSPLMRGRSLSSRFDALVLPLDEMKAAARRVEGKLNTVFMAGVAGGMGRYHAKHGADVPELRFAMPVSMRSSAGFGNHFAPTRFRMPINIDDPIARMELIRELTAAQRSEGALPFASPIARLLNSVPSAFVVPVVSHVMRGIDVVTSNVPGSPIPIYVAGARSLQNFGYSPRVGAAVNVTLISHMDELHVGVSTDPAAVPDPDTLVVCLQDAFDEVCKSA